MTIEAGLEAEGTVLMRATKRKTTPIATSQAKADHPIPQPIEPLAPADAPEPALLPAIAVALGLLTQDHDLIYLAADERRAEDIGRILIRLAPALDTIVLPPWDCLPFDRASPSREAMGRRVAALVRLSAAAAGPRIVVTTVDAAFQKLPPTSACDTMTITTGDTLDPEALRGFVQRTGYVTSERVDEPGDADFHGQVFEIYPPDAAQPIRVDVAEGGAATEISTFDPVSQRSTGTIDSIVFGATSEIVFAAAEAETERPGGFEHRMASFYEAPLRSVFDLMPDAAILEAAATGDRRRAFFEQLDEAFAAHSALHDPQDGVRPRLPDPRSLYVMPDEWDGVVASHEQRAIDPERFEPIPRFALEPRPLRAFRDGVDAALAASRTVVLAGVPRDLQALARHLQRHEGQLPEAAADWNAIAAARPGAFLSIDLALDEGVALAEEAIDVIAAADVLGPRAHLEASRPGRVAALLAPPALRIGDTVIHEDHGIGVLRGLETIEVEGHDQDAVRIEYHGGDTLLVPVTDLDKVWRYGSADDAVTLDRLHTDAWQKRRIEIEKTIVATAAELVTLARERQSRAAPKLSAPPQALARFAARFPHPLTPDQASAIAAVEHDLASGRPMDRLVCGDVGFGKTEVALRAAAIALTCGKQVALVAPTTVLARQHLETFRKRFAGLGFEIAGLSRLDSAAEARRVKEGLSDGSVQMVIGTQAVAGKGVAFADLGLLIIDEEQKFGAKLKAALRERAADGHVLTLTATPIPRTLQTALVGLQDVSVIATPPVRRRPVRTFVATFDPAATRLALLREKARGGQSFLIVPRIEEIEPMRKRLAEIVPELSLLVTHGDLPAEEADRAMVAFARGEGDVLLATNIVESGLDVPRANTMLVFDAERFGLAQLHQLRGRVGRGRTQGVAYLLSEDAEAMSDATRARLETLQSFERLGAGFEISARDLDLRGAGDLVGDDQAGHLRLIGLELYQRLLSIAVRKARGVSVEDDAPPELAVGLVGRIPDDYVAEPDLRIDLYARLSRIGSEKELAALAEEAEDRFGTPPEPFQALLALCRLRTRCRAQHVASLKAGPKGVAAIVRPEGVEACKAAAARNPDVVLDGPKLVWTEPVRPDVTDSRAADLLDMLAD